VVAALLQLRTQAAQTAPPTTPDKRLSIGYLVNPDEPI